MEPRKHFALNVTNYSCLRPPAPSPPVQSVVNALRFEQRVKQEVEREATMLPREAVLAIDAMSDDQATYKVHETMQIIAELKKSLDGANTVKSELLQGFQVPPPTLPP